MSRLPGKSRSRIAPGKTGGSGLTTGERVVKRTQKQIRGSVPHVVRVIPLFGVAREPTEIPGAGGAMMEVTKIREQSRLPAARARSDDADGLPTSVARLQREKLCQALLTVCQRGAGEIRMCDVYRVPVPAVRLEAQTGRDAEPCVLLELLSKRSEVARAERNVGVETRNEVVAHLLAHHAGVESTDARPSSGRVAFIWDREQVDP